MELNTGGGDVIESANLTGNYKVKASGGGTLTLTGNVTVAIEDDGITTVIDQTGATPATVIGNVSIRSTPDGANPALRDVNISFTADGRVDVYASNDLVNWGAPVVSGVTSAGPVLIQDLTVTRKFFVLVSAGQAYPSTP